MNWISNKKIIDYFSSERISRISGKFGITYDENGNLVARHNFTFQYDVFGRIEKVMNNEVVVATMFYHNSIDKSTTSQNNKLIMMIRYDESRQEIIQYFYGNRDNPFQVTAVFSSLHGWVKLYYDDKDRLFSISQRNATNATFNNLYYIITDISGTPTHVLNSTGKFSNDSLSLSYYNTL